MKNFERLFEWAQLIDEAGLECLIEVATILLADMHDLPLPGENDFKGA